MKTNKSFWVGIGTLVISMLAAASSHELVQENPSVAAGVGLVIMTITFVLGIFSPTPKK